MNTPLIKWILVSIGIIFIWGWLSGAILFFLVTHHCQEVSPIFYFTACWRLSSLHHAKIMLVKAGALSSFLMTFTAIFFMKPSIPNIYGKARFASRSDANKAGLLSARGILLGKVFGKYLRLSGYEHITLFAPTGTGKTIGMTIPNLLDWEDSCVVSDIKLQIFQHTSKYRESMGHKVYLWNPASPDGVTHCYNPLDVIGDNPYTRIDEIQKIAAIFIPDNPKIDPIWVVQSRFLFVALTLYVLDTASIPKNVPEVINIFKSQSNFVEFIQNILVTRHDLDPVCRNNFMKFTELHEKTRVSIMASFESYFELFDNPLVCAATAKSDFDIRCLRRDRMTIYVGVTNDNLVRLSPLLTIFYQQVADVLTRVVPGKDEPHGVLFLMDEFSTLRRMESFHKNIGLYREYKLRIVLIIQELSQLYDTYGRDGAKVFINAKVRIAYTQNDDETCKLIESMLGNKTIEVRQKTRSMTGNILSMGEKSESTHYASRALMLAQEIRLLPESKALILMQGNLPIYANKIAWFKQKPFKNRMLGATSVPSILTEVRNIINKTHEIHNIKTMEFNQKKQSDLEPEPLDQII